MPGCCKKLMFRVVCCTLLFWAFFFGTNSNCVFAQKKKVVRSKTNPVKYRLTPDDSSLLEDLQHRAFLYFWEHSDDTTGLTLDRAQTNGDAPSPSADHYNVASIAATGFALTSYCIAANRKWVTAEEIRQRTHNTLNFFARRAFHKNGWFYHWMDKVTGERRWKSEVSSIDTALLLGGILTVRQCFADDKEIVNLATEIYQRVDFKWMLNADKYLLSHGWHPETGFIKNRWHDYSEDKMLYLIAIGSPTHPISWRSWYSWERGYITYGKYRYLAAVSPLFIHQFSHAWIDFRGRREHFGRFQTDYFENSIAATRAQRQFFIDVLSKEFPNYNANVWGLTASDFQGGYVAWGAPPRHEATDGSVVPCAPGGSLMFTPDISLPALREMKTLYGTQIYQRYGFADAFNPQTKWIDPDVLGIDIGITMLSAENLQTQNVWNWFMKNEEIKTALRKARLY
jgi:hypothetical protein